MRQTVLTLVALVGLTGTAHAQSAAGTWSGETQGRGGAQMVTLTLTVDGSTLAGTLEQGAQSGPISEGSVNGNAISFQRSVEFGGNAFTLTYNGEIDGNTLTLTTAVPEGGAGGRGGRGGGRGAAMPIVLTRQ